MFTNPHFPPVLRRVADMRIAIERLTSPRSAIPVAQRCTDGESFTVVTRRHGSHVHRLVAAMITFFPQLAMALRGLAAAGASLLTLRGGKFGHVALLSIGVVTVAAFVHDVVVGML